MFSFLGSEVNASTILAVVLPNFGMKENNFSALSSPIGPSFATILASKRPKILMFAVPFIKLYLPVM